MSCSQFGRLVRLAFGVVFATVIFLGGQAAESRANPSIIIKVFTTDSSGEIFVFKLDGPSNRPNAEIQADNNSLDGFGDLIAGDYIVTEVDIPAKYKLAAVQCNVETENVENGVKLTLAEDTQAVCTFRNEIASVGSVRIEKRVQNPDGSPATDNQDTFAFQIGDVAIGRLGNGDISGAVEVVIDQQVTVSETPNDAFETDIDCAEAGKTDGNTINITATEDIPNVKCIVTNRIKGGSITVAKETIGGNDTFDFSLQGPLNQNFQLEGGESEQFANAPIGEYTITETDLPDDWRLENVTCSGVEENRFENQISFTLKDQQEAVCTFTNFKETNDRGEDVTKLFLNRRVDNLLSHGPDRARMLRRLDDRPGLGGSDKGLTLEGSVKDGNTDVKVSTSLSQIRAAAASAASKKIADAGLSFDESAAYTPYGLAQRLDLWVEGQIASYDDATGGIERDGKFNIVYVGVDYAIAPGVLIGGIVQYDRTSEDVDDPNITGSVEGSGWMAGPYLGLKLRDNLLFDARAAWGKSSNDINLTDDIAGNRKGSFETDRWLATASLTGNHLYGNFRISPQVSVEYGNEVSDDYFMSNLQKVNSADIAIGRMTFGPEFGYKYTYENGTTVEPHMSVKGIWTFEGDELELSTGTVELDELRASIEGGVIVRSADGYSFRAAGSYDGIGDDDLEAWSAKLWVNIPLN